MSNRKRTRTKSSSQTINCKSPRLNEDIAKEANFKGTGTHLHGRPVQVLIKISGGEFRLNTEELRSILLNDRIRNKNVVLLSVVGGYRKGKSFMLDFFMRYLNAQGSPDWLGEDTAPLKGFSWRGGSQRETTGIWLWSEPYLVNTPDGKEVAVILMDTQGTFDNESTVKENCTIFALSALLSSVLVYNIKGNIEEPDLQHLQFFTEYGRLALSKSEFKPFQRLLFLVRDWSWPYEHEYGMDGGQKLLEEKIEIKDDQAKELQQVRAHIKKSFDIVDCFLMPDPGHNVKNNPRFNGNLADIEEEFKVQLRDLVPHVLCPENLIMKQINGRFITGEDLMAYFMQYVEIFQGDNLPQPITIWQAAAETNNAIAVTRAWTNYKANIDAVCRDKNSLIEPELLKKEHKKHHKAALKLFEDTPKIGGDQFAEKYRRELEEKIGSYHSKLEEICQARKEFKKKENELQNKTKEAKRIANEARKDAKRKENAFKKAREEFKKKEMGLQSETKEAERNTNEARKDAERKESELKKAREEFKKKEKELQDEKKEAERNTNEVRKDAERKENEFKKAREEFTTKEKDLQNEKKEAERNTNEVRKDAERKENEFKKARKEFKKKKKELQNEKKEAERMANEARETGQIIALQLRGEVERKQNELQQVKEEAERVANENRRSERRRAARTRRSSFVGVQFGPLRIGASCDVESAAFDTIGGNIDDVMDRICSSHNPYGGGSLVRR